MFLKQKFSIEKCLVILISKYIGNSILVLISAYSPNWKITLELWEKEALMYIRGGKL